MINHDLVLVILEGHNEAPNGSRKWQVGGTRLAVEAEKAQRLAACPVCSARVPACGGTRQRHFAGTNFKPRKRLACTLPQAQVKTRREASHHARPAACAGIWCIIPVHFRDAVLAGVCLPDFDTRKSFHFLLWHRRQNVEGSYDR